MGNTDNANTCSSCFNWGSGSVGARVLDNSTLCTTKYTQLITDCKYYSGAQSNTTTAIKTNDCYMCDGKDWYNVTDNATNASINRACSNIALDATTCDAKVSNCDQSMCFKSTGNAFTKGCLQCSSGYKGGATAITDSDGSTIGYTTCVSATITNQELGSPVNNAQAFTCKSDYAVATGGASCVSFTTDSNCRMLGTGNAYCGTCWMGYYFTSATCTLAANLLAFGGLLAAMFSMM